MTVRKHFYFYGYVQGVGFRYRCLYAAQSMGLTGWVKNLSNDSVEMEIQGEEKQIDLLVDKMCHEPPIRVERIREERLPVKEGETGFHVRGLY